MGKGDHVTKLFKIVNITPGAGWCKPQIKIERNAGLQFLVWIEGFQGKSNCVAFVYMDRNIKFGIIEGGLSGNPQASNGSGLRV